MRKKLPPCHALVAAVACMLAMPACDLSEGGVHQFEHRTLDQNGPRNPWGKAVGDLNGDGFPDILIGGHGPEPPVLWRRLLNTLGIRPYAWPDQGSLVWYESPGFKKHTISKSHRFRTDLEVVDVDGDGRNDVVAITDQGLFWFRNPDWTPTLIAGGPVLHDIEVADFDGDGKVDLVARNQHLFGYGDGHRLHFYRQVDAKQWIHSERKTVAGEGLRAADIDGDGRPDIVVNQVWYRNSGSLHEPGLWEEIPYCTAWHWPHAFIDVADINGDGKPDIVMAPAEPAGMRFRLSWCQAPHGAARVWTERVIDPDVETAMHSIVVGDFDNDGQLDVAVATMHLAHGPKSVALYRLVGEESAWEKQEISEAGSHNMKAADFDQDGDLDLVGANLWGDHQAPELWMNKTTRRTATGWRRHVIDADKPWRSLFVHTADIDLDGLTDIVTGGWWYKDPGNAGGAWQRHTVGQGAYNAALVYDFDGDGKPDIFSSTWRDEFDWTLRERVLRKLGLRHLEPRGGFVWARNQGRGNFEVHRNVEQGDGDFLQGIALLTHAATRELVLSWHQPGLGLHGLQLPVDPASSRWKIRPLSQLSQDEQVTVVDLDRDGVVDLLLGTTWLRNAGEPPAWQPFNLRNPPGKPDRNQVADVDGDGQLDVIVGFEAVSQHGQLNWYKSGPDPTMAWRERTIARLIGPMSLGVADLDGDGHVDIVAGEHNMDRPATSGLFWFRNVDGDASRWAKKRIHVGDEHHDGAHVVDLDGDGDLDIVSIGWGHSRLVVYENLFTTTELLKKASR